jgi:hypothetical protein
MRLEMAQVQRLARNLGEELLRGLELSAPVNFPAQPADQGREVARGDPRVEAGEACGRRGEPLRRHQRPERIGGEVAEHPRKPVHVLHAAVLEIAFGGQTEITRHAFVPGIGDIGDGELARDQGPFQLEPEDDVERIGEFVRIDANVGPAHPDRVRVKVVRGLRVVPPAGRRDGGGCEKPRTP